MWNYTKMNEKHSLTAGSGASWIKRCKEQPGAACECCIMLVLMGDA